MEGVELSPQSGGRVLENAASFGFAAMLWQELGRGKMPITAIYVMLIPAILLRQIRFFFKTDGKPVGYVCWAYVSDSALDRLHADPAAILHPSEWNEGTNLWIVDVVARPAFVRKMASEMRQVFSGHSPDLRAVRRSSDGSVRRRVRLSLSRQS